MQVLLVRIMHLGTASHCRLEDREQSSAQCCCPFSSDSRARILAENASAEAYPCALLRRRAQTQTHERLDTHRPESHVRLMHGSHARTQHVARHCHCKQTNTAQARIDFRAASVGSNALDWNPAEVSASSRRQIELRESTDTMLQYVWPFQFK